MGKKSEAKKQRKAEFVPLSGRTQKVVAPILAELHRLSDVLGSGLACAKAEAGVPEDWGFDTKRMGFVPPRKKQ